MNDKGKHFVLVLFFFFLSVALLFSYGKDEDQSGSSDQEAELKEETNLYPAYLSLADGLHVTGTPVEVDLQSYRLEVSGKVRNPLSLTFEEVKGRESARIFMELNCPGFFTDTGHWTGVQVRTLLQEASVDPDAQRVKFTAIDGIYSKTLNLKDIQEDNVLIAYMFDDREFPVYHGFPLRIAAENRPGSNWVKWLGKIEVE